MKYDLHWSDIYGEQDRGPEKPGSDYIWCHNCQCWVDRMTLKDWRGDDMQHWLCPGCDADLIEPEILE